VKKGGGRDRGTQVKTGPRSWTGQDGGVGYSPQGRAGQQRARGIPVWDALVLQKGRGSPRQRGLKAIPGPKKRLGGGGAVGAETARTTREGKGAEQRTKGVSMGNCRLGWKKRSFES